MAYSQEFIDVYKAGYESRIKMNFEITDEIKEHNTSYVYFKIINNG